MRSKPTYEEMLDYLDSPETRESYEKIRKIVDPFDLCGLCKMRLRIPILSYLEQKSRTELCSLYFYVKKMIASIDFKGKNE